MNIQAVLSYLQVQLPHLLAVYIFGSQATGDSGPGSDLDIAILVDGELQPLRLWELAGELADVSGMPVDLLDLRCASTVMQYQIIQGRRLWAKDARPGIYESFILSEKMELDIARAQLLEDIQRDGKIHG